MIQNSLSKKLNLYDLWAVVREFGLLIVASLITNIGGVATFLVNINCPEILATMIIFTLGEIGRRYFKNYQKKVVEVE